MRLQPTLLLDIDGVLADFLTPCIAVLEDLTGQKFEAAHTKTWDIMEALSIPEDVQEEAYKRMRTEGFCYGLRAYEGSQDAVKRLREIADIYVVTAPLGGPHWAHEREKWLLEHYDISGKKIISTHAKYRITGDLLVDDKTANLVAWRKYHPRSVPVRWDQSYNQDDWDGIHTNSWDVLYGIVLGVSATGGTP